jgi:tetratricopeptide (TPR) repeat protein
MAGAAQADTNQVQLLEYLAKGTQKFPKDAELQMAYYDALTKAGQLQQAVEAARRAVEADPRYPGAMIAVIALYAQLNQPDSVFGFAQRGLAAGADSASVGAAVLSLLSPEAREAQEANTREAWEKLLRSAQRVDSIAPSPGSKYFMGLAAGNAGIQALSTASDLSKATTVDKPKVCAEAAAANDLFEVARNAMRSGGGGYDQQGALAIMGAVSEYAGYPGQIRTAMKCGS